MKFELSQDDYELLLIALGMAVGTAQRNGDPRLAGLLFRLVNIIGKTSPNFRPYPVGGSESNTGGSAS